MIIFQMTSSKNNCDYQFKYDGNGRIVGFEILGDNNFSSELTRALFVQAPEFETIGLLKQFALKKKIQLTEILSDMTFETFWKKYQDKAGSKKKAEIAWNKLSDKDKNLASNYIKKYYQSLGGTSPAYAVTYINGQYWIR